MCIHQVPIMPVSIATIDDMLATPCEKGLFEESCHFIFCWILRLLFKIGNEMFVFKRRLIQQEHLTKNIIFDKFIE